MLCSACCWQAADDEGLPPLPPLQVKSVINLLFAAYTGDVSALRRFALSSMDMEQRDYDSRTALHVAAAEGWAQKGSGGNCFLLLCVCCEG